MTSKRPPAPRQRRRAKRVADVDYDRTPDTPVTPITPVTPVTGQDGADSLRVVQLDDDAPEQLEGAAFYEYERPPHHG